MTVQLVTLVRKWLGKLELWLVLFVVGDFVRVKILFMFSISLQKVSMQVNRLVPLKFGTYLRISVEYIVCSMNVSIHFSTIKI